MNIETSIGERVASWAVSAAVIASPKIDERKLWVDFFEECRWNVLLRHLPEEAVFVLLNKLENLTMEGMIFTLGDRVTVAGVYHGLYVVQVLTGADGTQLGLSESPTGTVQYWRSSHEVRKTLDVGAA